MVRFISRFSRLLTNVATRRITKSRIHYVQGRDPSEADASSDYSGIWEGSQAYGGVEGEAPHPAQVCSCALDTIVRSIAPRSTFDSRCIYPLVTYRAVQPRSLDTSRCGKKRTVSDIHRRYTILFNHYLDGNAEPIERFSQWNGRQLQRFVLNTARMEEQLVEREEGEIV
jgi:hypothetical protein